MPDADDDELMQANPGVAEPDTPDIVKSADSPEQKMANPFT